MRKLLLVLFLCSLVSGNAFAKIEMWDCVMYVELDEKYPKGNITFKIDTSVPKVFWRKNSQWIVWTEYNTDKIIYDSTNDNIDVYHHKHGSFDDGNYIRQYPYLTRFDLVLRKKFQYRENGTYLGHDTCRVIN